MEIVLVRHGETEHNKKKVFHGWIDSNLNEMGIIQAKSIGSALSNEKFDMIISSPLKRARDTMDIINESIEYAKTEIAEGIKEVNFGDFEGLSYTDIYEKYNEEAKKWEKENLQYHFPGGESIQIFFERVKSFMESLMEKDYNKVLIVTHEGCIKCILSYITCGTVDLFWKYSVKTGSISRVSFDKNFLYIMSLNENI